MLNMVSPRSEIRNPGKIKATKIERLISLAISSTALIMSLTIVLIQRRICKNDPRNTSFKSVSETDDRFARLRWLRRAKGVPPEARAELSLASTLDCFSVSSSVVFKLMRRISFQVYALSV